MRDAINWRDLDIVNQLVCIATLKRASCTAIIVASGVSGIVLAFHLGGASSLRTSMVSLSTLIRPWLSSGVEVVSGTLSSCSTPSTYSYIIVMLNSYDKILAINGFSILKR